MPQAAYRILLTTAVVLACLPAYAQMSARELLSVSPGDTPLIDPRSPIGNDEEIPRGAAVAMPDMKLEGDEPVTMQADEMAYDKDNAIVIARGKVEVIQGPYILSADQLTYFQQRNLVQASGNVSILQPTGDVYFADYVELKDDMKTGVIHNFRARLADNSVFAANEAYKVNQNVTQLRKAAYTPCNLCENSSPFWQVKASEVEIDEAAERIYYENARMEFAGIPLLYAPLFSHPTPDADAKSGFLTPEYSSSGNLGTIAKMPYYWRIAPNQDVTLTPWYSTDVGALLEGDYRLLTNNGRYDAKFSATYPDELDAQGNRMSGNEFRGHIYASGVEDLGAFSRVGFNINRASDDTYLRRYRFSNERTLFSRIYAEAAQDRNYITAQGLSIQGLRQIDDPDRTPLVLPAIEGYYETDPYESGLRLHAFANAQSLTRRQGVDQHRLSMTQGASIPLVTDGGHVFTATANLRQDFYRTNNLTIGGNTDDYSEARILPQASLEWRYPLINAFDDGSTMTLEPIAMLVAQPNGNNPIEISNEDNTLVELTDTNLFALDRMPGLDLVDSGSRVAYGFRSQYLFSDGFSLDGLLGQTYNFDDDTPFPNSVNPGERLSDIIGRVGLDYQPISFGYRFALDQSQLASNRNEFTVSFYKPWLTVNGVYRALEDNRYTGDAEEGIINASMPVGGGWTAYGGLRRDLELDQMIASNAGLLYRNECFTLILQTLRTYTRDRDVEPSTDFTVRVEFKNLGAFGDN